MESKLPGRAPAHGAATGLPPLTSRGLRGSRRSEQVRRPEQDALPLSAWRLRLRTNVTGHRSPHPGALRREGCTINKYGVPLPLGRGLQLGLSGPTPATQPVDVVECR